MNSTFSEFGFFLDCLTFENTNMVVFMGCKFFMSLLTSLLVLGLGLRQCWHQRSIATASNIDVFTYHAAFTELMFVLGALVIMAGVKSQRTKRAGFYMASMVFPGQLCFHMLTCVERYLAVVWPVTYRALRNASGVRLRNVGIGCAWLVCLLWIPVMDFSFPQLPHLFYISVFIFALLVVTFCSFSVLWILIGPGPGHTDMRDRTKLKAFYTVLAIMLVLLVFFVGMLVPLCLSLFLELSRHWKCTLMIGGNWCSLPSTLLLPLLFLLRVGTLPCCRRK